MTKGPALVALAVALVVGAIIVLLVTGGGPPGRSPEDAANDVVVSSGRAASVDTALADIRHGSVYRDGEELVFELRAATEVPQVLKKAMMSWRWRILEGGNETWSVSVTLGVREPVASVLAARSGYGASTIDDTLPGSIDISGDTIYVRLLVAELEGFPNEFSWRLESSLDGDRRDVRSAIVSDTAPDSGLGGYRPSDR